MLDIDKMMDKEERSQSNSSFAFILGCQNIVVFVVRKL